MSFTKYNNLFGWISFVFALIVYALTVEPTGSLWDCGEFISASYGLQVVHPPGAPLFLLIGRMFSLFAGSPENVGLAVNLVSAISSALCVMFTFWITTYFARKMFPESDEELGTVNSLAIVVAGLVAAGTLTFSDTFWFSAVEAEVYAMSSFFMSFTFWCILKWERAADQPGGNRWLVFIGYIVGLAIGVHLLNLLVIPGIALVYYFRKYNYSRNGLLISLAAGFVLLFFVQLVVIPGIPSIAAKFDVTFVNTFGMGFNSGVIFFAAALLGGLIWAVWYTQKRQLAVANTILLSFAFILIGYSSYAMVVIRSNANPPIDMNNPDDPLNLVYYLNREQYGDRPLMKGPHFKAKPIRYEETSPKYIRGENQYEITHHDYKVHYNPKEELFFPRIYDGNDQGHVDGYKRWAGIGEEETPTMKHNIRFFRKYQLGHMYWRYFMWNFSGRQNDDQGMRPTDFLEGNWISGITPVDAARLGPQKNMPDDLKNNPSRNTYFMIPFILGILGIVTQFKREKHGVLINSVLFLTTGVLLIIYLNPPPYEPRERDYVFVGSFQVFSTWVGLGMLGLFFYIRKYLNPPTALAIAAFVGLAGSPARMGQQNWDDHDRSGRYMSTEFAKNYLKSCLPNAVLFTNGDNDTYPLWYVQNVEGYRTDVRVVNLSLLNAADYVESLRHTHYDSKPFNLSFTADQIRTGRRDRVYYQEKNMYASPDKYYELKDVIKFIASEDPKMKMRDQGGNLTSYLPTKKVKITVDKDEVIRKGIVREAFRDSIVDEMRFELPGNLTRASLILLDVLASNGWDRPVYFTTTTGSETYVGLQNYFELDGLCYKVVPIYTTQNPVEQQMRQYGFLDTEKLYAQLVDSFDWGGMEERDVWVDDKMRLVPRVMRQSFVRVANRLIDQGQQAKAIALLDECMKDIPPHNLPFETYNMEIADAYYRAGAREKAAGVIDIIATREHALGIYLKQFKSRDFPAAPQMLKNSQDFFQASIQLATRNGDTETANRLQTLFGDLN